MWSVKGLRVHGVYGKGRMVKGLHGRALVNVYGGQGCKCVGT